MADPIVIDPLAQEVLERLQARPQSAEIVLGGYFALQFHAAYRATHDIDAWWRGLPSIATEQALAEVMREVAAAHRLEVRERRFGETLSFELLAAGRKRFSFQIAVRSLSLDPPLPSRWPPILIETLRDNIASKMNALVRRGAPRDFTDIHRVVELGLLSAADCWSLWSSRNPGEQVEAARQMVCVYLAGLDARRPLEAITDPVQRQRAQQVRTWFQQHFLRA